MNLENQSSHLHEIGKLTGDQIWAQEIAQADEVTVLLEILTNPEYLTDPYYRELGQVLEWRIRQLKNLPNDYSWPNLTPTLLEGMKNGQ